MSIMTIMPPLAAFSALPALPALPTLPTLPFTVVAIRTAFGHVTHNAMLVKRTGQGKF